MRLRTDINKKSICGLRLTAALIGLVVTLATARAQDSVPLFPKSPQPNQGEALEVEQVEVRRLGAIPNEIHRKAGRFLLLVINRNRDDEDAAFVVDPASVGDGKVGPSPLLQVGGPGANDRKHRSASLFDAPVGEFDLKYAASGTIVCKIVID